MQALQAFVPMVVKEIYKHHSGMNKAWMVFFLFSYLAMQPDELMDAFTSKQKNELFDQGVKEINDLLSYMDGLEIRNALRFTPCLARGLEIYTGIVWEVFLVDGSIKSSVGTGGRYDNIIGAFIGNGVAYPAVGMTFGLDVIYEALMLKNAIPDKPPVDLHIIPLGTDRFCLKLATELRNKGLSVDIDMADRKLKKSLDYANKQRVPYVTVIGENELESGVLLLKEMKTGKEFRVCMEKLGELSVRLLSGREPGDIPN